MCKYTHKFEATSQETLYSIKQLKNQTKIYILTIVFLCEKIRLYQAFNRNVTLVSETL